jgi:nitroimidazol reductase NimA-like FMN-containing flavoprotein (pyridoxamine 5'-phosphate oxidase superfamily)
MLITKIRSRECREILTRLSYGRLACSCNNRPYIVPIYFAFETDRLCCFSTLGRKIEWMRENPLVCLEADEVRGHDDWVSVIVMGRYLEIPNTREYANNREQVRSLPQKRSLWWQSGYTAYQTRRKGKPSIPVFYTIKIEEMSGLRGSPDIREKGKSRSYSNAP